jgi:hypothetical protein
MVGWWSACRIWWGRSFSLWKIFWLPCVASALLRCRVGGGEFGAASAKEIGEHRATFFGEDAFGNFCAMVERGMVHDGEHGAAGAGLGVARGEDEARDARMEDGSGAHGAGLEGAEERAAEQAIVVECEASSAEGYDFRVGGGVVGTEDLIVADAEDFARGGDDDGADGDFAGSFGGAGLIEREAHVMGVGLHGRRGEGQGFAGEGVSLRYSSLRVCFWRASGNKVG